MLVGERGVIWNAVKPTLGKMINFVPTELYRFAITHEIVEQQPIFRKLFKFAGHPRFKTNIGSR